MRVLSPLLQAQPGSLCVVLIVRLLLSLVYHADASITIDESSYHNNSYALARVQKAGVLAQLVPIFANSFYPSLTKYVSSSDRTMANTSRESAEKNIREAAFYFEHAVLSMDAILEDQISMEIQAHPRYSSKRVRIITSARNVTGNFSNLATALVSAFVDRLDDIDDCQLSQLEVATRFDLEVELDFGLEADNRTITFVPQKDFDVSDFSLNFEVAFEATCPEPIREKLAKELQSILHEEHTISAVRSLVQNRIANFIMEHIGVKTLSISRIPPIKGYPGEIRTVLDIEAFMVSGEYVVLQGGALFTSVLSMPKWRQGRSLTPEAVSLGWKLSHSDNKLVGCSLDTSGLNALAESAWYLSWAEAQPTEDEVANSTLCEPSPNDPCPFPPLVTKSNSAMNIALGTFFLPSGLFKEFTVSVLVPPPKFSFHSNPSTISGTTSAQIFVDGTSRWSGREVRLANITMPASMTATIPSYDAETGLFHNLRIEEIRLEEPIAKFPRQPYINKLAKFPFHFAEGTVNSKLEEAIIPETNANIEKALSQLPLYINPLKNVPRKGLSLHFDLQSVSTSTVDQRAVNSGSFLTMDADLTITVVEDDPPDLNLNGGECIAADPASCEDQREA